MQDISCLVLPIPAHAFFKQAVLQGEIGHHLLQGGGFTTKVLHLAGRRGAGGVARQPALAGLQELLRPAVIHRGGNAFPAAQLRDVLLAAQSFQHNADLLLGGILLPRRPADVADKLLGRTSGGIGFLSHLRSLAATMSQKSSIPQAANFVSQALKRDTLGQKIPLHRELADLGMQLLDLPLAIGFCVPADAGIEGAPRAPAAASSRHRSGWDGPRSAGQCRPPSPVPEPLPTRSSPSRRRQSCVSSSSWFAPFTKRSGRFPT